MAVADVRTATFVRLKLRIVGNSMRGSAARIALFVLGLLGGLWFALGGFALFFAGGIVREGDVRVLIVGYAGAAVVLSWVLMPLLFFGVDETLDPARFALLPIAPRRLARGMLVAALVGIPPLATLIATLGLPVGAWVRGGPGPGVVALIGVVIGLFVCIAGSRAITSAFAAMLRSRRVRDLAAIIIAILASSIGPLQLLLVSAIEGGWLDGARRVAEIIGWTPLAAPYTAATEALDGQYGAAVTKLGIGAVTLALLLLWWSFTIESAMLGATSSSGGRKKPETSGSLVDALFPAPLRRLPRTRFGAIVARETRYWWRDPRRRAGLVSLLMAATVVPLLTLFSIGDAQPGRLALPVSVALAAVVIGLLPANQFGNDGPAFAAHLLAAVPGRIELLARSAAVAIMTLPVVLVLTTVAALLTVGPDELPGAYGTVVGAFGVALGVASLTSVLAAYALPDSSNPFAMNNSGASAKGLLALLAMFAAMVLTSPLLVALNLMPMQLRWITLPLGVAYGIGGALLGAYIAGDVLDRRAPEVLVAVTPKR